MNYFIRGGNTYDIKDDLKAWGCVWNPIEMCWETPWINRESEEITYKKIESLCNAVGARLIPKKLNSECQKIKSILNKTR